MIEIRKAVSEDVKQLNNFLTLLIRDEKQYDPNINENFTVTNMYEKYINDNSRLLLVAEEDDKIVGYLYGILNYADGANLNDVAKLDALYVEKEYRNRNIANSLINEFKKWALENKVYVLQVGVCSGNFKARNLYEKQGFQVLNETMYCNLEK